VVVVAIAAPAPALRVVSVTVIGRPAPASVGAVSEETCRSEPTSTVAYCTLLASWVSTSASLPSALASR
jgi:hypothetical protein